MVEKWLNVDEIALLISKTKRRVQQISKEQSWPYRSYAVRGGQERRYHIKDLPEDIQIAYAASLNLSLDALQRELKPPYEGRSKG
jgi:hypothetical protein